MAPLPALAVLVMLAASSRAAPSAEEQRLFEDGMKAWSAGDARGAERAWAEGYRVAHDPAFLVRVAEAEEKAGATAEAIETYRRYLREAPDASDRADVEQRVARLAPPPAAPAREPAEEPGELGAAARPTLSSPPGPHAAAVDVEAARPPADDSGWNRYNVTAMSAAGASVLLLGVAAFFGAEAASKESDVNRLQGFREGGPVEYSSVARQYESALADGRRDAHDARLALVGAAGAAVVSAAFFVLDAHFGREATVAVAPAATSGAGAGLLAAAAWRF